MKHLMIAILAALGLTLTAAAQVVDEGQARQIAQRFAASSTPDGVRRFPTAKAASRVELAWKATVGSDAPELYVYNVPSGGFVIVSGDEATEREVLGWSDSGSFGTANLPDGLQFLVEGYAKSIAAFRKDAPTLNAANGTALPRRAAASGYGEVKPLLKTTWDQDIDLYGHRYAGCVATALAGIMNYYQWPKQGYGSHTNFYDASQSVDFTESTYAWSNMTSSDYSKLKAARQKLLNDIGCAVNMHYDQPNGSEAYSDNAYRALITNFGYDESSVQYGHISDATIRDELRAKRVVFYGGHDTIYIDMWIIDHFQRFPKATIGHAMIFDGFSDDGLFHIDFGWGGQCNGYYSTKVIRPYGEEKDKQHSYAPFSEMIYGIKPQTREKVLLDGIYYDLNDDTGSATIASSNAESYHGNVALPWEINYEGKTYAVNAIYGAALGGYVQDTTAIEYLDFNAQMDELPNGVNHNKRLEGISIRGGITEVSEGAFLNCDSLHTVVIGDNVKRIGNYAFKGCDVRSLTLGNSLEEIGDEAFWDNGIQCLTLPAGLKCGRGVFGSVRSKLTELTVSDGVTELSDSLFFGHHIYRLELPASVKRIGNYALAGWDMINIKFNSPSFTLGAYAVSGGNLSVEGLEGCTEIGTGGLRGLSGTFTVSPMTTYADEAVWGNFDRVIVPAAAAGYNPNAISGAKYYEVEAGNPALASAGGYLYNKDLTHLYRSPLYDANETDIYIPRQVKSVSAQPLAASSKRLRYWLPEGLERIDARRIDGYDLRDVYCPAPVPPVFLQNSEEPTDGTTSDEYHANDGMNPHAVLHVQPGCAEAYKAAPGWKDIPTVQEDLMTDDGFIYQVTEGYDSWEKRTYYSASVVGHRADAHPGGNFVVPSSLKIGDERVPVGSVNSAVFMADPTVRNVIFGSFISLVATNSFRGCENLESITLGEECADIGESVFEGCTALKSVTLKALEMRSVGKRAFAGCTSLQEINLKGVRWPVGGGEEVFAGCTSLSTVRGIGDNTRLPARLFAGSGLESFSIGKETFIDVYGDVFAGCNRLHTLSVHPENESYMNLDGIVYYKRWDGTLQVYVCPPRVKLPNGTIADREVVNFSEKVKEISGGVVPYGAREVIFPASVNAIYLGACSKADKLQKVTCLFTDPSEGRYSGEIFNAAVYATATLQVPKGSKEKFQNHFEFKKFAHIVEIDPADYPSPEQLWAEAHEEQPDDPSVGTALTLLMKDGQTHTVRLASQPVLSVRGSELSITGLWLSLTLPLADVVHYTFDSYDATGIDDVQDNAHADLDMQGESLVARGLKAGDRVDVYDVQGRSLRHAVAGTDGSLSLPLKGLPTGTYVVKVGNISYKISLTP